MRSSLNIWTVIPMFFSLSPSPWKSLHNKKAVNIYQDAKSNLKTIICCHNVFSFVYAERVRLPAKGDRIDLVPPATPGALLSLERGGGSMKLAAESWWSEVTNLGHGLNGSEKNRLRYNVLLVRQTSERGTIVHAPPRFPTLGALFFSLFWPTLHFNHALSFAETVEF